MTLAFTSRAPRTRERLYKNMTSPVKARGRISFRRGIRGCGFPLAGRSRSIRPGVYVAGVSGAVCDPQFLNCLSNALASRLDLAGNEIWVKTAGTPFDHPFGYRQDASADGIAVDATGVYVTGALGTADVRRYDYNGNPAGKFGTGTLWGSGIVLDSSGIYITGLPCPPQCQFAGSVRKFHRNGTVLWTRELPVEVEQAHAIAGDGDSVYATGLVYHNFPQGPINAYVYQYASDGGLVSTDEFGAEPGTSTTTVTESP